MTFLQRIVDRLTGSRRTLPQLTLILIAGAAVYANSFLVRFVLDDYAVISTYGPRSMIEILLHGGPRRVVDATFALNYTLHGQEVIGYHAVNLLIHLAAAVTLYVLAAATLAALRHSFSLDGEESAGERLAPFAAALLFAVHPLQTQAVTYIVQRYTCLATLLYLLAALLFIRARLAFDREGLSPRTLATAGGTLAAALLALGSKQIAATLPLMLCLLEALLFRGRLLGRRFFLLCGAGALLGTMALLFAWRGLSPAEMLAALNNATSEHHNISRSGYFFTQLRVVGTYLRLLVLPYGQSIFHDYPFSPSFLSLPVAAAAGLHLCLLGCCAALIRSSGRRLRDGDAANGTLLRLAGIGIAWFYIALIIESSFFPITDWIFEHRVYLPSAGFFLAVTALGFLAAGGRPAAVKGALALLAVITVLLGQLTFLRNNLWSDTFLLWQDTVQKAPHKDLALANLAGEYMELNRPDKALPLFVRALEINPRFMTRTKIYLGMTLQRLNVDGSRFITGEEYLDAAARGGLSAGDESRLDAILFNNLGVANEYLGDPVKALKGYRASLQVDPRFDLPRYNLGQIAVKQGNRDEATAALAELQRLGSPLAGRLAAAMKQAP